MLLCQRHVICEVDGSLYLKDSKNGYSGHFSVTSAVYNSIQGKSYKIEEYENISVCEHIELWKKSNRLE